MKDFLLLKFYELLNFVYGVPKQIKAWWWVCKNPGSIEQARRLSVRVHNELKESGIEIPTKLQIDKYSICAYHDEETDTVHFPAVLMNPKLRSSNTSALAYMRHEVGHACIYHYYLQIGLGEFNNVFGYAHHPYDNWLFINWTQRPRDWRNYITKYAQVHPWEDFAECFMIYLGRKGKLNGMGKKKPAIYKKMIFVRKVLTELGKIDFSP